MIETDEFEGHCHVLFRQNVCDSNDYNSVLKLVNHKGLTSEVSNMLGIKKYTERAMDFLKNSKRTDLLRNLFPAEL